MNIKAVRGATSLESDDAAEMTAAVAELVAEMLSANGVNDEDIVSVLFTATPDLHSTFPATAARTVLSADVPLICAAELDIAGAMPRVIRVMMHVATDRTRADIVHVYQRGTQSLRKDLTK